MGTPRRVLLTLLAITGVLAVSGWVARRLDAATDGASLHHLLLRFDLAQEDGLATWFSTALFLGIAGLAWRRSEEAESHRAWWLGFAALALALSIEQVVQFRMIALPLLTRYVGNAWMVVAGLGALGVAAAYVPWLRSLPRPVARPIGVGVLLVLVGGIGLDQLGTRLQGSLAPPLVDVILSLEEGLELTGLSLITYGLLLPSEPKHPELS